MVFEPEMASSDISIDILSKCAKDQVNWTSRSRFKGVREFTFGQIIPVDLLLRPDFAIFKCRFEFAARNQHGSQHLFSLEEVDLSFSYDAQGVRIKKDGLFLSEIKTGAIEVSFAEWSRYFIQTRAGTQSSLVCEQHQLNFPSKSEFQTFASIDQGLAKPRHNRNLMISAFHHQFCRVISKAPHQPTQFSALLKSEFTPVDLESKKDLPLEALKTLVLGHFELKNSTSAPIRIRLNPTTPIQAKVYHFQNRTFHMQKLPVIISGPPGASPEFQLKTSESIKLTIRISRKVYCDEFQPVPGYPIGRVIVLEDGAGPQLIQYSDGHPSASEGAPGTWIYLLPKSYLLTGWTDPYTKSPSPTIEQIESYRQSPTACASQ